MGKIIFSPISKHLKLDFSMSHSDERSLSEEISPVTASTSFELASSHARVTSIKFTKQESVSELVSDNGKQ